MIHGFMSLNNIQIPAIVLQDLYKNVLIDLETETAPLSTDATGSYSFLGDNQKGIAIIVNDTASIYLRDDELNFLLGILSACKLSMADVALLNLSKNTSLTYTGIGQQLAAEKVILFGVEPSILELPLQFPHYQIQKYNNQVYLSAPALKILENNKAEKTRLWTSLKQVFPIG
jgi:hypothetical protein